MPIVYKQSNKSSHLFLWEITEDLPTIEKLAQSVYFDSELYKKLTNKRRKSEWLITRLLLHQFDPSLRISYTQNGKPFLNNQLAISISHSQNMVGIYLSNHPNIGLDIEKSDRHIGEVARKFISEKEFELIKKYKKIELLVPFWCSKEVVFKAAGLNNIDFKKNIQIEKIKIEQDKMNIDCKMIKEEFNEHYQLNVIDVAKNVITFTVFD